MTEFTHSTVLRNEVIELLTPVDRGIYIDATVGLGGHSEAILEAADCRVIGIDRDEEALAQAKTRLASFGESFAAIKANFSEIKEVAENAGISELDGIVADLGISSMQLDDAERGFSFRFDAPLDMRMDQASGEMTAAEFLAATGEVEIANTIYKYGEERRSRRIARLITERKNAGNPVETTRQLAELVIKAIGWKKTDKIHPATRTFQALRIAVNGELAILDRFVTDSVDLLTTNGVLAVISFHSLEDRIIKRAFQRLSGKCECPPRMPVCACGAVKRVEIATRKPIIASEEEFENNPRSRSAKLRACRKL